jgi:hypothetical protein
MKKLIVGVTALGLCLGGMSGARADWVDNFDGAAFDARWGEDEPNTSNGEVELDTVNDTALFTAHNAINMWGGRADAPILWTAAPAGSYIFETHVAMSTGQGGSQAGIVIYSADGSVPNFTWALDHWNAGNRVLHFQGFGDNIPSPTVSATGGEAWLRLKVMRGAGAGDNDHYEAQYKLNAGDPWTVFYKYEINIPDARVGIMFKTDDGGKTADYSYARLTEIPTGFTDNFDGTLFDDRWGEDEPNPALGAVTLDTVNDVARFESFGNLNMWGARQDAPILWTPAPEGDFSVETHVTMSTLTNGAQAGLTVYEGEGARPEFVWCLDHWGTQQFRLQGMGDNNPDVTLANATGQAWLRFIVQRDGGAGGLDRYVCQYKFTAGAMWTTLTIYDWDTANARIGLFMKASATGRAADFSYVRVEELSGIVGGDVIKLDFSTAGDADGGSVADWNQVGASSPDIAMWNVIRHGDGAYLDDVAISFANFIDSRVNNDGNANNWGGTGADPYYIQAVDDIYYHGGAADLSVTFSGLDSVLTYDVRVYSLIGTAPGNIDKFIVTDGTGTRSIQNTRTTRWSATTLMSAGTLFTGVSPNASDEITVTVEDVTSPYYPLNAIVLEANTPSQGTLFMLQ